MLSPARKVFIVSQRRTILEVLDYVQLDSCVHKAHQLRDRLKKVSRLNSEEPS